MPNTVTIPQLQQQSRLTLALILGLILCAWGHSAAAQHRSIYTHTDSVAHSPINLDDPGQASLKDGYKPTNYKHDVFEQVEKSPEFPGGMRKLFEFIKNMTHYPATAKDLAIQGRVILQFIVERNGTLSHIVALRGPGYGLNEEAVRVMKQSPKWKPGIINGHKVKTRFVIPVYSGL